MAQAIINVGATANDGTGDTLRLSQQKANLNFTELYGTKLDSVVAGTNITVDNTDPLNPIIKFEGVIGDGVTIFGSGTALDPLYSLGGGGGAVATTAGAAGAVFAATAGIWSGFSCPLPDYRTAQRHWFSAATGARPVQR